MTLSFCLCHAQQSNPDLLNTATVQEMTIAQIYRYARELYLRGEYEKSIPIFQKMLSLDCHNKLAHHHLKLISKKSPTYIYLNEYIDSLLCEQKPSTQEDLLPSSFFYETDPSLLRAHMIKNNQKNAQEQQQLKNILQQYVDTTTTLQKEVHVLSSMIENNKETIETKEIKLLEAQTTAEQLRSQIDALQQQISTAQQTQKPLEINQHHQTILTLQEQLSLIQQQLTHLETTLIEKNNQLNTLTNSLSIPRN